MFPSTKRFKGTLLNLLDIFEDFTNEYSDQLPTIKLRHLNIIRLYSENEDSHVLLRQFLDKTYIHWNDLRKFGLTYLIKHADVLVSARYKKYIDPIITLVNANMVDSSYTISLIEHINALIRICIHYLYNNNKIYNKNLSNEQIKALGKQWNVNLKYTPHEEELDDSDDSSDTSSSLDS